VFFSGTAAEITPIRSIDRIKIGSGRRGPIAEKLQKAYFGVIDGSRPDKHGWLSHVHTPAAVK
jgi:branched-chain amino acid aminotransferase